jgi:D-alanyl-D-alanine carboxypeptidase
MITVLLGVGLAFVGVRSLGSSPPSSSIVASAVDSADAGSTTSLAGLGSPSSSATAPSVQALEDLERGSTTTTIDSSSTTESSPGELGAVRADRRGAQGEAQRGAFGQADGVLPDGATVFDDELPGIAKLDPVLLDAVRRAATDAANDGIRFVVNSGWRSGAFQDQMHREAVAEYGSEAEASKWVATADTSAHVTGDAVDLGPSAAREWLSHNGPEYGLCQIYANEPWHFELRLEAIDAGCPAMSADAAHDPRMQP